MELFVLNLSKHLSYLLILTYTSTFIFVTQSEGNSPTIEDLLNITCSYEQPVLCLPFGACCRISEYCHAGQCEPCLSRAVRSLNREQQMVWCRDKGQHDISLMESNKCRLACLDLFTLEEMTSFAENVSSSNSTLAAVPRLDSSSSYYSQTSTAAIVLSSLAVGLMLAIIIVMLIYLYRKKHRKTSSKKEMKTAKCSKNTKSSIEVIEDGEDLLPVSPSGKKEMKTAKCSKNTKSSIEVIEDGEDLLPVSPSVHPAEEDVFINLQNKREDKRCRLAPLAQQEKTEPSKDGAATASEGLLEKHKGGDEIETKSELINKPTEQS